MTDKNSTRDGNERQNQQSKKAKKKKAVHGVGTALQIVDRILSIKDRL